MLNKKKILATALGAVFAISAFGSAFAAEETTTQPQTQIQMNKLFGGAGHFGKKGTKVRNEAGREAKLAQLAAEKGITVEELKAQREQNRGKNLEQLAQEKGITVDELKAQMKQEREARHQAKLDALAKEKGITVEALKAEMEQKREAKLAELAKQKGITVEELKAQFEQEGHHFRGKMRK
ncbi:hypothetical protein [Ammoniphilus sp. CFH 90114]|uniref:hypothetical protein n=1 Tax=Ammoniphilus sp. CFH 90114 TaxID=2493665 RepID=UPI00100DE475|nr:hypothetical protein [Ammoniphilus sp. CFH 90114]RXT05265.1 hypothetical protein EIZ39_17955 [Ammoniphilus sp. CFH 90114]